MARDLIAFACAAVALSACGDQAIERNEPSNSAVATPAPAAPSAALAPAAAPAVSPPPATRTGVAVAGGGISDEELPALLREITEARRQRVVHYVGSEPKGCEEWVDYGLAVLADNQTIDGTGAVVVRISTTWREPYRLYKPDFGRLCGLELGQRVGTTVEVEQTWPVIRTGTGWHVDTR